VRGGLPPGDAGRPARRPPDAPRLPRHVPRRLRERGRARPGAPRGGEPGQREHARGAGGGGRPLRGALGVSRDPGAELVEVLDDHGRPVATVTRREMRARRLPHGSTYVLVFNRLGELFVHMRSPYNYVYTRRWDVDVG